MKRPDEEYAQASRIKSPHLSKNLTSQSVTKRFDTQKRNVWESNEREEQT